METFKHRMENLSYWLSSSLFLVKISHASLFRKSQQVAPLRVLPVLDKSARTHWLLERTDEGPLRWGVTSQCAIHRSDGPGLLAEMRTRTRRWSPGYPEGICKKTQDKAARAGVVVLDRCSLRRITISVLPCNWVKPTLLRCHQYFLLTYGCFIKKATLKTREAMWALKIILDEHAFQIIKEFRWIQYSIFKDSMLAWHFF